MLHYPASSLLALIRRLLGEANARPAPDQVAPEPDPELAPNYQTDSIPAAEEDFSSLDSVSCVSNRPLVKAVPMAVGPAGIALIKRFEGCARLRPDGLVAAYPDPGTSDAPWTIGWGATGRDHVHGGQIGPDTIWTQAQCDARLADDLVRYGAEVASALGDAPTTQPQFDALVSFHYNTGAIARATLTARHRAGDSAGALREFARWNRAGGRVLKGLVRRRAAEAQLYQSGVQ